MTALTNLMNMQDILLRPKTDQEHQQTVIWQSPWRKCILLAWKAIHCRESSRDVLLLKKVIPRELKDTSIIYPLKQKHP